MPLNDLESMLSEYRDLNRRVKLQGIRYDELTAQAEAAGEIYLEAKLQLENLQLAVMESFAKRLDEEGETVQ
jgi:hypothetical protein